MASEEECQRLAAEVARSEEGVHVVVNNAGGTNFIAPFLDMRLSGWDKVMRLNLDAAIYVCQAAGRCARTRPGPPTIRPG